MVAGFVGVLTAVAMVGGSALPASAQSVADLQAQINSLLATIQALQAQLVSVGGGTSGGGTTACTFTRDLTLNSQGADVTCLQQYLTRTGHFTFSGGATGFFGNITKTAVAAWQAANGVTPAAGYFGPISKAKYSQVAAGTGTTPGTPGTPTGPAGTGISVSSGSQPAASLAPESAARVPFTRVVLTASNDGDITVNGITIERAGLAQNSVFSGVVLLDQDGTQIGVSKTLNSNNQATVGEPFVVKRGTSKTVTIAGNMAATLDSFAGQVVGLNVIGINTSATVSGALPITGAGHTVNATLALGSATLAVSSFDPNTSATKEVGTTGYNFAGIRVTAGSAEKVKLWSIRWNQTGSVGSNDLANVMVYVDGTAYPTTVSADGKYYTALFGSGISIDKGLSKDVYVKADIVGSNAAGRTVIFDIDKSTDIYLTGETFGYGITPTAGTTAAASDDSSQFTTGTPFFDGSKVTVSAGSVTTLTKSANVPSQNIAVNVPNQPLGGFEIDLKGEAISVQQMIFTIATTGTWANSGVITNVSIFDENGAVVAGPVDQPSAGTLTLTFTDTVTFPIGKKTYTIKGQLPSGAPNNGTVILSTTPSSQWSNITGQTTGNTISLSTLSNAVTLNTMTVKAAALAISVSPTPSAQTVIAGGTGITFANYQFDATQSGEDVRFSNISLQLDNGNHANAGAANLLSGCQLFDGTSGLNTGSNVVNPTNTATTTSPTSHTFTFDTSLTITKGTVKTLTLKCNLSGSGVTGSVYAWGIVSGTSDPTVTGVTSSNSVTETITTSSGQNQTVAGGGSLTVAKDSSSPSYTVAAGGTSGVTLGVLKLRATDEAINLERIALQLTGVAATSTTADVTQVTLWDGVTQVGTIVFAGSSRNATATLTSVVQVPKDTDKLITIKGDMGLIGSSQPGLQGALVIVDYDGNDSTGTRGTGANSGATINTSSTSDTAMDGVRNFRSFPTLALDTLSGSGVQDGRLMRFRVTASSAGDVGIGKFTFTIATSSATVSNVNLFGYTDSSYSQAISGLSTGGQFMASNQTPAGTIPQVVQIYPQTTGAASTTVQVPAGATRFFELRGTVTNSATNFSVTATLDGDSAFPNSIAGLMGNTNGIDTDSNNDLIWSPNATTSSAFGHVDWTNGFGLPGLPSSGIIQTRTN